MSAPVRGRRALVCAPLPPEHDRESGSRRIFHMIEFLLEEGWSVAFVCENAPEGSRHLRELRQRGVATYVGFGGRTADLLAAGSFDVAIFAFWYLAERHAGLVRQLSPRTRILVESVDLHWLRNARRLLDRRGGAAGALDGEFGRDLVGELNAYSRADGVLTVSAKEAEFVNDIVGEPGLARAVADCDEMPPSPLPFERRRGILFIGNFRHPPNLDAVRFLCGEVLPALPADVRAEHPLSIVGNGLDGKVEEAAAACPEVRLIGWVPSLTPYLHAARATVVPLRYGAGTKRKLIQSLLARTPAVSTPVGIEGLQVRDGAHLLVGRDAASLAAALARVVGDRELWNRLAAGGRRQTLRLHGRVQARARFVAAIEEVLARPGRAEDAAEPARPGGAEAVRRAVEAALPPEARVLVVSKGDPELVRMPKRRAGHFPQAADGRYAGFHPADSPSAVRHLQEIRRDAEYLLIPAPSFWWLDYYQGFAHHLANRHERVWADQDCVIYRLARPATAAPRVDVRHPGAGQANGQTNGQTNGHPVLLPEPVPPPLPGGLLSGALQ